MIKKTLRLAIVGLVAAGTFGMIHASTTFIPIGTGPIPIPRGK